MRRLHAVVLFGCLALTAAYSQQETARCSKRTISTSGTAETGLSPDYADVHIGVDTSDRNVAKAMSANTEAVRKVMVAARQAGVKDDDVSLDYVSLRSEEDRDKNPPVTTYTATQKIEIRVRNLRDYDKTMALLIEAGANRIDSVQFQVAEMTMHLDDARREALRAARKKAEALAAEAGMHLGKACVIDEQPDMPFRSDRAEAFSFGTPNISIVPGKVTASATVSATFELLE